jgi:hypothetical protein
MITVTVYKIRTKSRKERRWFLAYEKNTKMCVGIIAGFEY